METKVGDIYTTYHKKLSCYIACQITDISEEIITKLELDWTGSEPLNRNQLKTLHPLYKDFLYWCGLTGFNHYFWHRKAIASVALKIINTPKFRERVAVKLCNEQTMAEIDAMIMEIIRFNKQKWVM